MQIRMPAVLLALLSCLGALAQNPAGKTLLKPFKTDRPPVVDGVLDDPVWAQAATVTDFQTFIPEFGKLQPEKTIAYMAYDSQNLYFAFRCFDGEPQKIKASLSRRDNLNSDDFVCINLDTFNDQQSLYAFYVTPLGVQADSRFASNKEDFSVDMLWDSAARMNDQGYTVEIRIPLKSIRFTLGDRVLMSVFFERTISRRQEHGSYPALDPKGGYAFLPQMAPMEYLGLERPTLLELLPAFTHSRRAVRNDAGVMETERKSDWSLTGTYGITPSLILDATLNPDFSQVEADAGQVDANLRYGLFFPEKRPFFLEGSENFNIAAAMNSPLQAVLHTRTIVDPKWGAKVTGKVGPRDTLAVLAAEDTAEAAETPDPRFSVLRYKRTLQDDGYLGLFYTDRKAGERDNRVIGPDGQYRLSPSDLLGFHAFGSFTRPDAAQASSEGQALGLEYIHDTSRLGINAALHRISEHFEADAGYLTRTGLASGSVTLTPRFYPASSWVRRLDPFVGTTLLKDDASGLTETDCFVGATAILQGNGSLTIQADDATEVFLGQKFRTDGVLFSGRSQLTNWLNLQGSYRQGKGIRYTAEPFQGHGSQTTAALVLQPTESLNLTLNWAHADFARDSDNQKIYDYSIYRSRLTFQLNQAFFLRAIFEYNAYRRQLLTDFLASYTYTPGTVVYLGYGSLYKKQIWEEGVYRPANAFLEMQRGLFFKASYLWRL